MSPKVSVVVPNYNCEEFLDKCLEHIVNQTYTDFECLVCDNGSDDRSVEIINKWAAKDDRIIVLINEVNQGLINCYNRMFFAAKGDYIMIQDADDWCSLDRIEKQLAVFEQHDVGCVMTNCIFYSDYTKPAPEEKFGSKLVDEKSPETWAPATIMFKRETLELTGGFNKYFDRLTSYDRYQILEIVSKYGGYYLDEYLYHVWARPNSDHRSIDLTEPNALRKIISYDIYKELRRQRIETGTDWLRDKDFDSLKAYEQKLLSDKKYMAEHFRRFACIQLDHGNIIGGKEMLMQAIKTAPLYIENYKTLRYYLTAKKAAKNK